MSERNGPVDVWLGWPPSPHGFAASQWPATSPASQLMRVMGASHRLGGSVPRSKRRPAPASPCTLLYTQSTKLPTRKDQRGQKTRGVEREGPLFFLSLSLCLSVTSIPYLLVLALGLGTE